MPLTRQEYSELEGLIEKAWGEDPQTLSSLLLDVADTPKLRKLLTERSQDIEPDDPVTARRLRQLALRLGGRVLSVDPQAVKRREHVAAVRAAATILTPTHCVVRQVAVGADREGAARERGLPAHPSHE